MDYQKYVDHWPRYEPRTEPFESRLNMYERQIDQLFEFTYKDQDDIKILFKRNDDLMRGFDTIQKQHGDVSITELHNCIKNYYQLELENKRRMESIECYQFQLFIVQIVIMGYLLYSKFM
jgi:hypothetical protein